MKTILFPTDFSSNTNSALEYALEIATIANATLHLLHVYTPGVSISKVTGEVTDAKPEALEKLKVITDTIAKEFSSTKCKSKLREGDIVTEIIAAAEQLNADLIIMGTLGASKLSKVLFGSNTAAIIEKSKCAVLAVPADSTYRIPQKILFATNFSYKDLEGAKRLARFADAFNAEIILGHVDLSIDEDNDETASMMNLMNEIKAITSYTKIAHRIVSDHNVMMGLDKIIEENNIDMFALSTHKRTWFEKMYNPSLTKKLSLHTNVPLVVFHTPPDDEKTGKDF